MKMITRSNYEIYFVDYFDGKLDKKGQAELFKFLDQNPDLKREFNTFSSIKSEPDISILFENKNVLKRETVTEQNYKTWLFGELENDLSIEQKNELERFLSKHPSLKTEREIVQKLKVTADTEIKFGKKNQLKKGGRIISFNSALMRTISVAAVIIVFLIAFFLLRQQKNVAPVMTEKSVKETQESIIKQNTENDIANKNNTVTEKNNKQIVQDNAGISTDNQKSNADKSVIKKRKSILAENNYYASNNMTFSLPAENSEDGSDISESNSCESYVPVSNVITASNSQSLNTAQDFHKNLYKEIFDDADLKDLGINNDGKTRKENPKTVSLIDLASGELKQLAKSADIVVDKKKDVFSNATTYALSIGKQFSVSHTTVR